MLNKPGYIGVFLLDSSKVLMYKFHYDYIKNKYGNDSRLLFTGSDSLIYETKMKISMNILAAIKKCLILVIIQPSQNTTMIQTN